MFTPLNIPGFIMQIKQNLFVLSAYINSRLFKIICSNYFCGFIYRFVILICLFLFIAQIINGQSLHPAKNQNHYIVLIDASGSTTQNEIKRKNYEKALFERLISNLYKEGFGPLIPPYDPKQDWLTVHQFGIVTGDATTAYRRLVDYDLLTQFIHPVFIRKKEIDPDYLKTNLIPAQTYRYTILSWAKQLSLENSQPQQPDDVSNRSFMILIHDGEPNENSLAEEVNMVRQWNRAGYEKALPVINSVNNNYRFTNGESNNEPAWSDKITAETNDSLPVFIEAYEIVSVNQAKWEFEGKQLKPLDSLEFQWIKESGNTPEGELTAVLNKEFETWLNSAEGADIGLSIEQDGKLLSKKGLEVPVSFNEPLSCGSLVLKTSLDINIQATDKLLGRRTINYTYPATVSTPPLLLCTAGFYISGILILIVLAFIIAALTYFLYYRLYNTHLEIEIPGNLVPIQLKRQSQMFIAVSIIPRTDMEALTLKFPSLFKQYLFYRGAIVTIVSDKGQIQWSNGSNSSVIKLPLAYEYVLANWIKLANEPSHVTLIYQQGRQITKIFFSYPRSIAAQHKEENV